IDDARLAGMIRRADYYRKLPVVGKKQWKGMARLVYFTVYGIESNVREQTAHVTVGNSDLHVVEAKAVDVFSPRSIL
ncbi:hypothetical protein, partial [Domibacillus tundrae]|uniref:hypothetical protein n=1 Tax=Domibacillus tundrae TaxID=1587527 RepID=UPI0033992F0B